MCSIYLKIYPFKEYWQIDEAIDTLNIFNVDAVDGVTDDDRFYYWHLGKGLVPLIKDSPLKRERDQLYRRVGGINAVRVKTLMSSSSLFSGILGHINFDLISGFKINSDIDYQIADFLAKTYIGEE